MAFQRKIGYNTIIVFSCIDEISETVTGLWVSFFSITQITE